MTDKIEKQTTDEAWRQVGRQFQALGESLAEALRTAWESDETQQHAQNMKDGLEAMIGKISQAIKEASDSPEAQKIRGEAEKASESLRTAAEQTWEEVRPQLLSALNQVNAELQRMLGQPKGEEPLSEAEGTPDGPESTQERT